MASKFRNAQGDLVDLAEIPATRFKNEFASMFERAAQGKPVAITKHDKPKAVLISYGEFEALTKARGAGLGELEARFDALLAGMQTPRAKRAMAAAFDTLPGDAVKPEKKAAAARRKRRPSG